MRSSMKFPGTRIITKGNWIINVKQQTSEWKSLHLFSFKVKKTNKKQVAKTVEYHSPQKLRPISDLRSLFWLCFWNRLSRAWGFHMGQTCLWLVHPETCLYPAGPGPPGSGLLARPYEWKWKKSRWKAVLWCNKNGGLCMFYTSSC